MLPINSFAMRMVKLGTVIMIFAHTNACLQLLVGKVEPANNNWLLAEGVYDAPKWTQVGARRGRGAVGGRVLVRAGLGQGQGQGRVRLVGAGWARFALGLVAAAAAVASDNTALQGKTWGAPCCLQLRGESPRPSPCRAQYSHALFRAISHMITIGYGLAFPVNVGEVRPPGYRRRCIGCMQPACCTQLLHAAIGLACAACVAGSRHGRLGRLGVSAAWRVPLPMRGEKS